MRRAAAVVATALLAPLLVAAPAAAEEPPVERTAWFAATGAGGLGAPSPTVEEDDLRVQRSLRTSAPAGDLSTPSEVLAFSALLYRAPGARASLDLTLREGAAGTPAVQACATVGTDWEAGPNQPLDALQYDCSIATAPGVLSEDGTTLSFAVDDRWQPEPGVWSIAIVPTSAEPVITVPPQVPLPFSVDLAAPEPGQFRTEAAFELPVDPAPSTPGSGGGSGTASGAGFLPGGFGAPSLPSLPTGTTTAPLLAGGSLPAAPAPATAPRPAAAVPRPLAVTPAGAVEDLSAAARTAALLALAVLAAAVGWAAGQQRPGPQLLGGRARAAGAAAVALPPARPRGHGRFARVRDTAPRRLR